MRRRRTGQLTKPLVVCLDDKAHEFCRDAPDQHATLFSILEWSRCKPQQARAGQEREREGREGRGQGGEGEESGWERERERT